MISQFYISFSVEEEGVKGEVSVDNSLGIEVGEGAEDTEGPTTEERFFEDKVVDFVVDDFFGKVGAIVFRNHQETAMFSFDDINVFAKIIYLGVELF